MARRSSSQGRSLRPNYDVMAYSRQREGMIALAREIGWQSRPAVGFLGDGPVEVRECAIAQRRLLVEMHARLLQSTQVMLDKGMLHESFKAEIEGLFAHVELPPLENAA